MYNVHVRVRVTAVDMFWEIKSPLLHTRKEILAQASPWQ